MTTRPVHPFMAALAALAERVRVAHGAMSPMLQARNPSQGNFAGLEGCTEIRYVTRPDIVRAVHRAYLEVGVDATETKHPEAKSSPSR